MNMNREEEDNRIGIHIQLSAMYHMANPSKEYQQEI